MRIRYASVALPALLAAVATAGASFAAPPPRGLSPSEPGGCELLPQGDAFHQDISALDDDALSDLKEIPGSAFEVVDTGAELTEGC